MAVVVAGTVAGGAEHAGVVHAAGAAAIDDLAPLKHMPTDLARPDGAAAGPAVAGQRHGRLHGEVHGDARHQLGLGREPAVVVLHEAAPEPAWPDRALARRGEPGVSATKRASGAVANSPSRTVAARRRRRRVGPHAARGPGQTRSAIRGPPGRAKPRHRCPRPTLAATKASWRPIPPRGLVSLRRRPWRAGGAGAPHGRGWRHLSEAAVMPLARRGVPYRGTGAARVPAARSMNVSARRATRGAPVVATVQSVRPRGPAAAAGAAHCPGRP